MTNFKHLLLLFFICTSCLSNKTKPLNEIKITGNIKNIKDSTLVILEKIGIKKSDSLYAVNGKFSFSIRVNDSNDNEGLFFIDFKSKTGKSVASVNFWVESKDLNLKGDLKDKKNLKIENSYVNNLLINYRNIPEKYSKKLDELFSSNRDKKNKNILFNLFMDSIKRDQINFLYKNPNTSFSLNEFFRFKNEISQDSVLAFYKGLKTNLKESKNGKLLEKLTLTKRIKLGEMINDFEAEDIDGNLVKLSDYKGSLVLLDFWADWCKFCHVQNKKEFSYLNKKYKEDLIIISYSLDEVKDVWKKSTERDSYKWVNLSNLKGMKDPLTYQYGVSFLPHSFLIDKEGKLINQFIGYKKDSLIEKEIKKIINK